MGGKPVRRGGGINEGMLLARQQVGDGGWMWR